jgi:hypothetical protein
MALPETDEANAPQISLNEAYGAAKQGLTESNPEYTAMYDNAMSEAMPALMSLSDKDLDLLLQLMQYLQEHPEEYQASVKELEDAGVIDKGDFPPEYDENFLAVFGAAVLEAQRTNEDTGTAAPTMQPPMQLAKGGIAEAARMVAASGRSGDTMLAHINKKEAALLKKHGGAGTLNPRTGLREYGWNPVKAVTSVFKGATSAVKSVVKSVGSAVKGVLNSSVGRIVATVALAAFLGPGAFGIAGMGLGSTAAMGLASAGITALSGGNLKDVVKAGVTGAIAGFGAEVLGPALGSATGVSNAAGQAAMGAGAASTGSGLLQGRSIKDSVKDGMTSAAIAGLMTGSTQGFDAQVKSTNAPVEDRVLTPESAGKVGVNQTSGEVTGGAPTSVQPQQPVAQNAGSNLSTEPRINVSSTSADPLGDFAAQNEVFRNAAATPTPAQVAAPTEATWWDKTKDYFSPSARAEAGALDAGRAYDEAYAKSIAAGQSPAAATKVAEVAAKGATPGVLSNYGPAIGAGLGITALAGGFKPQDQPQMSEETQDMISGKATQDIIDADPSKYITQNLPGVTYDAKGNITGSAPWTPRSGAPNTEVAGNYIPFSTTYTPPSAPVYSTPSNSLGGGRQIQQPYNTASMYDFRPRYAAQGGMMETQGAFPGNPLTMQSNPAMAMGAHQLPMNTSGVPMNLPMGLANGGIASMSPQHFAFGGVSDVVRRVQEAVAAQDAAQAGAQGAQPIPVSQLLAMQDEHLTPAQRAEKERLAKVRAKQSGLASLATGGYPRRTGQISGPGTETSDDIPAMLSDGEFVMTAKAVKGAGGGSRRAGAKKMYALMHRLEKNAARG